jgi:S-adenosyl methyltransferase
MSELPPEIDTSRPHTARIYDYFLGGKNHFAADREVAEKSLDSIPSGRIGAREQRAFLGRAVSYLAGEAGIRQFLDIGTGLPTTNNVHEVAQAIVPSARVVYVDNDPLVLAHAQALLTSSREGRTAYIHADLRSPGEILSSPVVREVLDCSWASCIFSRTRTSRSRSSPPCLMPCRRAHTSPLRISTRNMTPWGWPPGCAPISPAG